MIMKVIFIKGIYVTYSGRKNINAKKFKNPRFFITEVINIQQNCSNIFEESETPTLVADDKKTDPNDM